MNNVVALLPLEAGPLEPEQDVLLFEDMRFTRDPGDGWIYIEDTEDDLDVLAFSEDEAKALRDWLIKVLP